MEQLQYGAGSGDYLVAMRSVRIAKNVFWLLGGLMIALQIAAFLAVEFGRVTEAPPAPAPVRAASSPASAPAEAPAAASQPASAPAAKAARAPIRRGDTDLRRAVLCREALRWILPASQFLVMLLSMLLGVTMFIAMCVALQGRLVGVGRFVSAFFWSVLLVALAIPWQHVAHDGIAMGAFFDDAEMFATRHAALGASASDLIVYYVRFVAYPAAALLVWLAAGVKFGAGYRRMTAALSQQEPAPPNA